MVTGPAGASPSGWSAAAAQSSERSSATPLPHFHRLARLAGRRARASRPKALTDPGRVSGQVGGRADGAVEGEGGRRRVRAALVADESEADGVAAVRGEVRVPVLRSDHDVLAVLRESGVPRAAGDGFG